MNKLLPFALALLCNRILAQCGFIAVPFEPVAASGLELLS